MRKLTPAQHDSIPTLYQQGLSTAAIALRFGIVSRHVLTILRRCGVAPRRKLTERQRDSVVTLYQRGLSSAQIAAKFGIAPTYVLGILIRRGVPRRPSSSYHVRHGDAQRAGKTKEYRAWWGMIARCRYPSFGKSYRDYGGRGIRVCYRWERSFVAFLTDIGRAPSPRHSLERIDNDGDYRPGNVRWASKTEQARNTRASRRLTHDGQTLTVAEWAQRLGINRQTIQMRLGRRGWSVKLALTTPVRR